MHLLAFGAAPVFSTFGASFNIPTEPRISLIRSNNGVVRLPYQGQTNYQYILRASTNLQSWTNLDAPFTGDGQIFRKLYPARENPKLFYRVEVVGP